MGPPQARLLPSRCRFRRDCHLQRALASATMSCSERSGPCTGCSHKYMAKSSRPRKTFPDTSIISSRFPVQPPRLVKRAMSIMIFPAEINSSPYRHPPPSTGIASHPGHQYKKISAAPCLGLLCQNPANACCESSSVLIQSSWPLAAWKLAGRQLVIVQTSSSRWRKKSLSVKEHAFACSRTDRTPCTVATSASEDCCAGLNINPLKIVTSSLRDAWTAVSARLGRHSGITRFELDGTKGSTTGGDSGLGETLSVTRAGRVSRPFMAGWSARAVFFPFCTVMRAAGWMGSYMRRLLPHVGWDR
jgi:hypothetical protein